MHLCDFLILILFVSDCAILTNIIVTSHSYMATVAAPVNPAKVGKSVARRRVKIAETPATVAESVGSPLEPSPPPAVVTDNNNSTAVADSASSASATPMEVTKEKKQAAPRQRKTPASVSTNSSSAVVAAAVSTPQPASSELKTPASQKKPAVPRKRKADEIVSESAASNPKTPVSKKQKSAATVVPESPPSTTTPSDNGTKQKISTSFKLLQVDPETRTYKRTNYSYSQSGKREFPDSAAKKAVKAECKRQKVNELTNPIALLHAESNLVYFFKGRIVPLKGGPKEITRDGVTYVVDTDTEFVAPEGYNNPYQAFVLKRGQGYKILLNNADEASVVKL